MKQLLDHLITILQEMIVYHRKLHTLLKKEKKIMIKHSLEEFERCTKEKETITLKIKLLEESRIKTIKRLSSHMHISENELTISRLSEICKGNYSNKFKEIGTRFSSLIADINQLNTENRSLIECFMNHIKLSLSFLKQSHSDELTYLNNGEAKGNNENGRVLCKA